MEKARILDEIRRTTEENGGVPVGRSNFEKKTGIRLAAWSGKYWRNWSEAVAEAGFAPNERPARIDEEQLLRFLASLTRELGRFPTDPDVSLARTRDPSIPHYQRFKRLGDRGSRLEKLRRFSSEHAEFADVVALLPPSNDEASEVEPTATERDGAVYMLKLGKHFKIGKSFRVPQRHREIALELPEKPDVVHVITTDDPSGIEAYWHNRFAEKRTNGEWFALSRDDVRVFMRRKFM